MKNCLRAVCCGLLLACAFSHISAFPADAIRFKRISMDEGLSQSTVFSIVQDRIGNMWFATYDGINKYDGYDFTVYRHDYSDSTSVANDIIKTLYHDSEGRIWAGTASGLSLYNAEKDNFTNYGVPEEGMGETVNNICQISDSLLLVCCDRGTALFDIAKGRYDAGRNHVLKDYIVSSTLKKDGTVYVGTDSTVFRWNIGQGSVYPLPVTDERTKIQSILEKDGVLWIGTEGNGLYGYNLLTSKSVHFNSANSGLASDYVRALEVDSQNRLWIGTFGDLCIYDEKNNRFDVYSNNPSDPRTLSQQSVRSLLKDRQGGMWVGTFYGGLNYYHPLLLRFRNIRQSSYTNSLNDNVASCIVEDASGSLWIGTNAGGVNRYEPKTEKFTYYLSHKNDDGVESNDVKAIYIDEQRNEVYVGAHAGGINVINRGTGRVEHYRINSSKHIAGDVYSIIRRNSRSLWVGTLSGLYIFDMQTKRFAHVLRDDEGAAFSMTEIMTLSKDPENRLWAGGPDGLSVYTLDKDRLGARLFADNEKLGQIRAVQDFYRHDSGDLWIATRSGLYCWREKSDSLSHFTTEDGLPNNVIYGIEADSSGHLWISTNRGLSCIETKGFNVKNYSIKDGLEVNQFNTYSHCRTRDGRMYFGGINGITTFLPDVLAVNPYSPTPVLSKLLLYNKPVLPGDSSGILDKSISLTDRIDLKHFQRSFSFVVSVPDYVSGKHNLFAYRLAGYDDKWYTLPEEVRTISYSNLPAGRYRLEVKSSNSDALWCQTPASLEIVVHPVWYNTWWAIVLIIIVIGCIAYFLAKFLWERKTMAANLEMERKEKEAKEEINQMKMRFFINISHELRTPLTLIVAPLHEMMAKATDKWMRTQLKFIERNTNRLLHLVNQLMDYRRAELGVFKLRVTQEDVYSLVKDNLSFYDKLAQHKHLNYDFISDMEGKTAIVDKNYIDLIVNNLISNAFKYTDNGGITVRLTLDRSNLVLEVSDTGVGIPIDKQDKIFERFMQIEKQHIGSGIGLSLVLRLAELHHGRVEVDSEVGRGSRFTVTIPQDKSAYSPEELVIDIETAGYDAVYTTNPKEMYYIDTDTEKSEEETNRPERSTKGKVLVVEDNDEIRNYLNTGLSSLFEVVTSENGEEALERLKDEKDVDLVISDVMMPVMDGIKLCKAVKQNISTSHIPVIMLSAKTDLDDMMEAYQIGADDYVPKPFSLHLLTAKVNNILRTRRHALKKYSDNIDVSPENVAFNQMDEELLRRAVESVRKNLDNESFSTEDFARELNMSRSNLHLKMKALTGESALDFIRKIRFSEACALLKEGKLTIAEISYKVGFATPSYFTTCFKKYVGCLPTEYQKYGK